jgi:hypothetical protein
MNSCYTARMSTATAFDPRATLGNWTSAMMGMYVSDIQAIPDEKWTASMGGCTRPASEQTAEVVSILDWATGALKGQIREVDEKQLISEYNGRCATREGATSELQRSVPEFVAALAGADDERLCSMVTAPCGDTMPLSILAHIASSHLWYHDGQLNYIQSLLGDKDYHW